MALEDSKTTIDEAFTRTSDRGPGFENTFAGALSFLRRRYTKDLSGVDIAVTGIPFDQAVTNRPGTRLGPRAIREASALQSPDAPYGWGYNPLEAFSVVDYGDLAFDYAYTPAFPDRVTAHIGGILEAGAASVVLGGDHSITLPILKAYAAKYGPISLIQVDAHTDTWVDDEISVGDFILSGGEIPTLMMVDGIVRLIPGVINHPGSAESDSFQDGLLDCSYYTRPEVFRDMRVPDVLLSGNHQKIAEWRMAEKLARTRERRPDLYEEHKKKNQKT